MGISFSKNGKDRLFWGKRVGIFAGTLLALTFLFSPEKFEEFDLKEGDYSPKEIIAPIGFPVLKDKELLKKEEAAIVNQIPLILEFDEQLSSTLEGEPDRFFQKVEQLRQENKFLDQKERVLESFNLSLSPSTISFLLSFGNLEELQEGVKGVVKDVLEKGILPTPNPPLSQSPAEFVLIRRKEEEFKRRESEIFTPERVKKALEAEIQSRFSHDKQMAQAFLEVAQAFLRPNLSLNLEETNRRREEARRTISPYSGSVSKGEKIIGSYERVGPEEIQKIRSLEAELARMAYRGVGWRKFLPILGGGVLVLTLLLLFFAYLYLLRPLDFKVEMNLLLVVTLILTVALVTRILTSFEGISGYAIPLPFGSMLAVLLFDIQMGMVMTVFLSLLLGSLTGFSLPMVIMAVIGGAVAAYSVRNLRHRWQIIHSLFYLSLANLLTILAIDFRRLLPLNVVLEDCGFGLLQGFLSGGLTMVALPMFESLFRVATPLSLLELSDFNKPLLKKLSIEAPGTYQHSLLVSSLAEAACEAIGANSLLARVSSYYHDIGKAAKPEYFIENQIGLKNRHDRLSPKMSTLIVVSHVKEGLAIAKKERLPQVITDCIEQHHGTSLLTLFYQKACRLSPPGEVVSEDDYRYPGPKPQRKEIGVVMLADAVEAASRALRNPTPARLRGLVKKVIFKKFNDLELDECDLSLKDLHRIGETFLPILLALFHPRLEYEAEGEKDEDLH